MYKVYGTFIFVPGLDLCTSGLNPNRPYALTAHLHNNDAMLGVKTCRAARTCWKRLALSQCAGPGRPDGMACRGWPAGCMLGDGACDSASFDPQHARAPFCDVICIRSILVYGKCTLYQNQTLFSSLVHIDTSIYFLF